LNIVVTGAVMIAVPELRRRWTRTGGGLVAAAVAISGALLVITAAWCLAIWLLPDDVVRALLGDSAADALSLLPILFLYSAANMAAQGPLVALRATGSARRGTRATAPVAPLVLFGASIGAWLTGSATGALVAWGISGLAAVLTASWQLRLALREPAVHFDHAESLDEVNSPQPAVFRT
jgi:hypothetical protein